MGIEQSIQPIIERIETSGAALETEEATKNALIMPMLRALGYDVFNPNEVVPEYTADTPGRRAEKVDYAILLDGGVRILVECKSLHSSLDVKEAKQLFRYFNSTDARLAILTDGETYKFYTDVDAPNRMDDQPFLTLSISQLSPHDIRQLERFEKSNFDTDIIVATAEDLKYRTLIKREIASEFASPSEEFVRLLTGRVYSGRVTPHVREKFEAIVKSASDLMIRELVNKRLRDAIHDTGPSNEPDEEEASSEIITTDTEIAGYHIVQAIAAEVVDPRRVGYRDAQAYCAILLDNNNRKTICRLFFNNEDRLRIVTFVGREETRHELSDVRSIYKIGDAIRARLRELDV